MMGWADWIGSLLGFVLTLAVFSYLIGDNQFFRIVLHLFIGVSAGFAASVVIYNVILPRMIEPLYAGGRTEQILALVPIILAGLLVTKISPRFAHLGNLPMAYLVGVSAAAAIGGAVLGTLIPQTIASMNLLDVRTSQTFDAELGLRLINGIIILVGTIATLAYFQFSRFSAGSDKSQLQTWIEGLGQIGQVFIAITFGFLFAGVFSAALTALIGQVLFLVDFIRDVMGLFIQ
jgi:hypothetical protein